MRNYGLMACLLAAVSVYAQAFKPDHRQANIDGMEALMYVPEVRNERGEWELVRLAGCNVVLAPRNALHEHRTFPCNEWFLIPAVGTYQVWMATDDAVSVSQLLVTERAPTPYKGTGSVVTHRMERAGFVTLDGPVPDGHVLKYLHLGAPGLGFFFHVPPRRAGQRFAVPPGQVVAGIFNAHDEAVAYGRPMSVTAGETTTFRVAPPDSGTDLVAILRRPAGHRDGTPLDLVVRGSASKAPDVVREQRTYVVAVWYGLRDARVTFSADSPTLQLERDLDLRPRTVSTLRADLVAKGEKEQ